MGEKHVLHTLKQGDVLGQYSVLFNQNFLFSAEATTQVRVLTLDQDFFINYQDQIEGLKEQLIKAEHFVEQHGIPICDFKLYQRKPMTPLERFKRAVDHTIVLNKLNSRSKKAFAWVLNEVRKKVKKDKKHKLHKKLKNMSSHKSSRHFRQRSSNLYEPDL